MLNFEVLNKDFFVEIDRGSNYRNLLLHTKDYKKWAREEDIMTISEAFEFAKAGKGNFYSENSARCAWALDAILKELGKEHEDFLNIAMLHAGDKASIQYFGTDPGTAHQYTLANIVLGFEKGTGRNNESWAADMRELLIAGLAK